MANLSIQEVEALETTAERFDQEINNLKKNLETLTTDGSGLLYDLKQTVGPDSDLGATISAVGGSVMSAQNQAINSLTQIKTIIDTKIAEAKAYNAQAQAGFSNSTSSINSRTFE